MSCECQLHAKITYPVAWAFNITLFCCVGKPTAWRQPSSETIRANVKAALPRHPDCITLRCYIATECPSLHAAWYLKPLRYPNNLTALDSKKQILWRFNDSGKNNTYIGLQVGCPIFRPVLAKSQTLGKLSVWLCLENWIQDKIITTVRNKSFERVEQFRYLGTILTNQNFIQDGIKRRSKPGNASYHIVSNLSYSHLLTKNIKIKIYSTIVLPVVLYGCETWSLTFREERRLRVFENSVLRGLLRPNRDVVTGEWTRYLMRSFTICIITNHYSGDQIKKNELGGACSKYGR